MGTNHYSFSVSCSEIDKEHVGLCAEFPSLSFLAEYPADALVGIRLIVEDVVQEMENKEAK